MYPHSNSLRATLRQRMLLHAFLVFAAVSCAGVKEQTVEKPVESVEMEREMASDITDIKDPWEPFNRPLSAFNLVLYRHMLRQIAQWYIDHVPSRARISVSNFFSHIGEPHAVANHLLQGNWDNAGLVTARFVFNSTVGIGGLTDPGKYYLNLPPIQADFGQTLSVWGIPPGPYLALPLLGPSSVRHSVGVFTQVLLDPLNALDSGPQVVAHSLRTLNRQAQIHPRMPVILDSIDPYVAMRDFFVQSRRIFLSAGSDTDDELPPGLLIIDENDFFNDTLWEEYPEGDDIQDHDR